MYSRAPAFHPLRRGGGDDRSNYFVPSRTGGGEEKVVRGFCRIFIYLFIFFLFFRILFGDFGGEEV